jgi:hypothetical protein
MGVGKAAHDIDMGRDVESRGDKDFLLIVEEHKFPQGKELQEIAVISRVRR